LPAYAKTSHELLILNIDTSKFRAGLEIDSVIQLIEIVLDRLLNKDLQELINLGAERSLDLINQISCEVSDFFDLLKRGVYK
jgi:hypothetical protein